MVDGAFLLFVSLSEMETYFFKRNISKVDTATSNSNLSREKLYLTNLLFLLPFMPALPAMPQSNPLDPDIVNKILENIDIRRSIATHRSSDSALHTSVVMQSLAVGHRGVL